MKTIEELSRTSAGCCRDIYHDFTLEEVKHFPKSVQEAWKNGKELTERHNYINNTGLVP